jgi:hypothetical protein
MQEKSKQLFILLLFLAASVFQVYLHWLLILYTNSSLYDFYEGILSAVSVLVNVYGCVCLYLKNVVCLNVLMALQFIILFANLCVLAIINSAGFKEGYSSHLYALEDSQGSAVGQKYIDYFWRTFYLTYAAKALIVIGLIWTIFHYRKMVLNKK